MIEQLEAIFANVKVVIDNPPPPTEPEVVDTTDEKTENS
jgi:hypothetical protein